MGLRLTLLVDADVVAPVGSDLEEVLPGAFAGRPTRFAATGETLGRHWVDVEDVASFVIGRTDVDATAGLSVADWLSLTGQGVLEVTAGPVFVDTAGG